MMPGSAEVVVRERVLAHMAATTPVRTVSSRISNTIVNDIYPYASEMAVDPGLVGRSDMFELAAFPAAQAPHWGGHCARRD